jgi:hypothetical protein
MPRKPIPPPAWADCAECGTRNYPRPERIPERPGVVQVVAAAQVLLRCGASAGKTGSEGVKAFI